MIGTIYTLLFLPWIFGALVYIVPSRNVRAILTNIGVFILSLTSFLSILLYQGKLFITLPLDSFFLIFDFLLLAYFFYQGIKHKHKIVSALAFIQFILLAILSFIKPHEDASKIIVDELSIFMFLLVNVIGGLIAIYALQYIKDEDCEESKRRYFIALLLAFMGVMNLLVCANDLEWFFLAFELTTLASFLLIRFRMDEISITNALRALWMNQIGGVAILVGLIISSIMYKTIYLNVLLGIDVSGFGFLAIVLLSIAAMIKGAQIPFDRWLLGAMVAPTPVSAILHSATMVKIAPFLIIKLSPLLSGTVSGFFIALLGGIVFVSAGILALSRENFKEILAYSTIGLLGLMILLGAIGSKLTITAALMLMLFHGIAKALLFLEAGVLEKKFHAKKLHQMIRLIEKGPISVFLIVFGFISLTLPPFGAFIGKWLAVESVSFNSFLNIFYLLNLLFIVIGSVILVLLYFRVLGVILSKDGEVVGFKNEELACFYKLPTLILGILLLLLTLFIAPLGEYYFGFVASSINPDGLALKADGLSMHIGFSKLNFAYILLALLFMLMPLIFYYYHFRHVDRVKEYKCAERMELRYAPYYFECNNTYTTLIQKVGTILFLLVILTGGLA